MCVSANYLRCCITLFSIRCLARSLVDLIHRKHCEGEEDRRVVSVVCAFNGRVLGPGITGQTAALRVVLVYSSIASE